MAMMQGCSLTRDRVEKFVIKEQYSITYSEYEGFLLNNIDYLSEEQRSYFATRLKFKPQESDKAVRLLRITTSDEGVGKALFSVDNKLDYRLVSFSFDKEGIKTYDVKTLYGVK